MQICWSWNLVSTLVCSLFSFECVMSYNADAHFLRLDCKGWKNTLKLNKVKDVNHGLIDPLFFFPVLSSLKLHFFLKACFAAYINAPSQAPGWNRLRGTLWLLTSLKHLQEIRNRARLSQFSCIHNVVSINFLIILIFDVMFLYSYCLVVNLPVTACLQVRSVTLSSV